MSALNGLTVRYETSIRSSPNGEFMNLRQQLFGCLMAMIGAIAHAQETLGLDYVNPGSGEKIRLEAFLYSSPKPNGKVIVFSHGSTGGNRAVIAESIKFMRIGKLAADRGYHLVSFMRKGRGKSEGAFLEETGRCDRSSLTSEVADAYPQLSQVVDWSRRRFNVEKVILMGHSRGGFLSAHFSAQNPDRSLASVNLAGVWSAFCEGRNGGFSHDTLKNAATQFRHMYWAYFENDTYFAVDRFNDPQYDWMSQTANQAGIRFKKYPQLDMKDGHATPTWRPEVWANDVFDWLDTLQ